MPPHPGAPSAQELAVVLRLLAHEGFQLTLDLGDAAQRCYRWLAGRNPAAFTQITLGSDTYDFTVERITPGQDPPVLLGNGSWADWTPEILVQRILEIAATA